MNRARERANADGQRRGQSVQPRKGSTRAWRKARTGQLQRQPLCELCRQAGRISAATEVDHRTPRVNGGALLDEDNLQSLCHDHHASKTAAENVERRHGKPARIRAPVGVDGLPLPGFNHPWAE